MTVAEREAATQLGWYDKSWDAGDSPTVSQPWGWVRQDGYPDVPLENHPNATVPWAAGQPGGSAYL